MLSPPIPPKAGIPPPIIVEVAEDEDILEEEDIMELELDIMEEEDPMPVDPPKDMSPIIFFIMASMSAPGSPPPPMFRAGIGGKPGIAGIPPPREGIEPPSEENKRDTRLSNHSVNP